MIMDAVVTVFTMFMIPLRGMILTWSSGGNLWDRD